MLKTTGRSSQSGTRRGQDTGEKSVGQGPAWEGRSEPRSRLPDVTDEVPNSVRDQVADRLIADMARGFVAAQAKMGSSSGGYGEEMLQLLQKISHQLDDMHRPQTTEAAAQNGQGQNSANSSSQASQQPAAQSNASSSSAELQTLFSQLLTAGKQGEQAGNAGTKNNQAGNSGFQTKGVPAQTAAQVLAQAQFELSKELETSLQKLKQVISESEELANRIGNLIGKENNSQ